MPDACQLQLGTSGIRVCPVGGASPWRAIGLPMSQTSRLTMVQNTSRLRPGSFSGGRSTIAEKSARPRGSIGLARFLIDGFFIGRVLPPAGAVSGAKSYVDSGIYANSAVILRNRRGAITSLLAAPESHCSLRRIDHVWNQASGGRLSSQA